MCVCVAHAHSAFCALFTLKHLLPGFAGSVQELLRPVEPDAAADLSVAAPEVPVKMCVASSQTSDRDELNLVSHASVGSLSGCPDDDDLRNQSSSRKCDMPELVCPSGGAGEEQSSSSVGNEEADWQDPRVTATPRAMVEFFNGFLKQCGLLQKIKVCLIVCRRTV